MKAAQRNQISGTKKVIISFEKASNNMAIRHSLGIHWKTKNIYGWEIHTQNVVQEYKTNVDAEICISRFVLEA